MKRAALSLASGARSNRGAMPRPSGSTTRSRCSRARQDHRHHHDLRNSDRRGAPLRRARRQARCLLHAPDHGGAEDHELRARSTRSRSTIRRKTIFSGWMFAESPGLNAVEHAIYDVWLTGCRDPNAPPPVVEVPPDISTLQDQIERKAKPRTDATAPSFSHAARRWPRPAPPPDHRPFEGEEIRIERQQRLHHLVILAPWASGWRPAVPDAGSRTAHRAA